MPLTSPIAKALQRGELRRRLDPQAVVASAHSEAGPGEFGDNVHREALEILIDSLEREARLTPLGRLLAHLTLTRIVANRLRLIRVLREEPDIVRQPLLRPLIVVGLPRTGTTLLQSLLAAHPAARPLLFWESLFPAPLAPEDRDGTRRRDETRRLISMLNRVAPEMKRVHPLVAEGPEECTWLLANTLVSPVFSLLGRVPGYFSWLQELDAERWSRMYTEYRIQLQVLQSRRGGGHWVLKSPLHLQTLDHLLKAFPRASVIQMHRDPLKVVPSTCSLLAVHHGMLSGDIDPEVLGRETAGQLAVTLQLATSARELYPGRVLDVYYHELVRDKLGTVRRIHEHFGFEFGRDAESAVCDRIERDGHSGEHRYDLGQFGLSAAELDRTFASYRERFRIPRE